MNSGSMLNMGLGMRMKEKLSKVADWAKSLFAKHEPEKALLPNMGYEVEWLDRAEILRMYPPDPDKIIWHEGPVEDWINGT